MKYFKREIPPKSEFIALVFIWFALPLASYSQSSAWETVNPRPTFSTLDLVEFVSEDDGFVSNAAGTYSTNDGGETWDLREDLPAASGLEFFENHGVLVRPNYSNYSVFQTFDGGLNWEGQTEEFIGHFRNIQFIDESTLVITTSEALYVSATNGQIWSEIPFEISYVSDSFFLDDGYGFLITSNGFIYATENYGQTWDVRFNVSSSSWDELVAIDFISPEVGFVSLDGFSNHLIGTTDGGLTWELLDNGVTWLMEDFHFVSETMGFMAGEYGKIYKTNNAGQTWEVFNNNPSGLNSSFDIEDIIAFDENKIITVGRNGRISRTTDGGETWVYNSNLYSRIRDLSFSSSERYYALDGRKVYRSEDEGFNWEVISDVPVSGTSTGSGSGIGTQIVFVNETEGYLARHGSYGAHYYRTDDGGETWDEIEEPNPFFDGVSFLGMVSPDTLLTATSYSSSLQTSAAFGTYLLTNNGEEWTEIYDESLREISIVDPQTFIGLDYDDGTFNIVKTTNSGLSWDVILEIDTGIYAMHWPNELMGFCAIEDHAMMKTLDGGDTWQFIDYNFTYDGDVQREILFVNDLHGFIQDEDGGIRETIDGGENWNSIGGVYGNTQLLSFENHLYAPGTYGYLIRRQISEIVSVPSIGSESSSVHLFPNPADEVLNVQFQSNLKPFLIEVFDLNGRMVKQMNIVDPQKSLIIDVSENAAGIYFIRIIGESRTVSSKFVLN